MSTVIGKINQDCGQVDVDCGIFSCSFFPGHLFPVFFATPQGPLPSLRFADSAVSQGLTFLAYEERHARHTINGNSPDCFDITCEGLFCRSLGTDRFCDPLDGLTYTLRWLLRKGSPRLELQLSVAGTLDAPVAFNLNAPVWRDGRTSCNEYQGGFRLRHETFTATASPFTAKTTLELEAK